MKCYPEIDPKSSPGGTRGTPNRAKIASGTFPGSKGPPRVDRQVIQESPEGENGSQESPGSLPGIPRGLPESPGTVPKPKKTRADTDFSCEKRFSHFWA